MQIDSQAHIAVEVWPKFKYFLQKTVHLKLLLWKICHYVSFLLGHLRWQYVKSNASLCGDYPQKTLAFTLIQRCWPHMTVICFGVRLENDRVYWICKNGTLMWAHRLNTLWPSDTLWRHKSGTTLAQVMDCCLAAPNHYLNQCWLLTNEVLWHSPQSNFTASGQAIVLYDEFENFSFDITATSPNG